MPRSTAPALLLALIALFGPVGPAGAQAASTGDSSPTPDGGADIEALQLRDRIAAVVDEDPILASDIDRAITLGLVEQREGESDSAFRRRVLDSLIDQRVRFHEVTRFGLEQVPVSRIEEQVEVIRARFSSEEELRHRLAEVGLDLESLRQLVARQLVVWTYFEEFLGPRVFVSLEDIREYYEETLLPELEARDAPVPPIERVREEIRQVLKEQRLNDAIETRTEELRRDADIINYYDSRHETLPPIVLEID